MSDDEGSRSDSKKQGTYIPTIAPRDMRAHTKILFDKTKKFSLEYTKLRNRFERALIEHKLAVEYYGWRYFWIFFMPAALIATLITILGFLISGGSASMAAASADGDANDGAEQDTVQFEPLVLGESKQFLSFMVGILGAISTLLTTVGKYTNYQSKHDAHQAAVKALEKINLTVDFEREWFKRTADSEDFERKFVHERMKIEAASPDADLPDVDNLLGADLKSHQASFRAMQDACGDSPIPTRVTQAFTMLDQTLGTGDCTSPDLIFHYNKLMKEFDTYWAWPLLSPKVDVIQKYKVWQKVYVERNKIPTETTSTTQTSPTIRGYQSIDQGGDTNSQGDKCCLIL